MFTVSNGHGAASISNSTFCDCASLHLPGLGANFSLFPFRKKYRYSITGHTLHSVPSRYILNSKLELWYVYAREEAGGREVPDTASRGAALDECSR